MAASDLRGLEHRQTVIVGKVDNVVGVHAHAVDVLFGRQSVAVYVSDEFFLFDVVLPNTHGGGTPDVAVQSLYDEANGLARESPVFLERFNVVFPQLIAEKPVVGSDKHVALLRLAE